MMYYEDANITGSISVFVRKSLNCSLVLFDSAENLTRSTLVLDRHMTGT